MEILTALTTSANFSFCSQTLAFQKCQPGQLKLLLEVKSIVFPVLAIHYTPTEEDLTDWERITPEAREAIVTIDDQKLDSEMDMSGMKMTYYK